MDECIVDCNTSLAGIYPLGPKYNESGSYPERLLLSIAGKYKIYHMILFAETLRSSEGITIAGHFPPSSSVTFKKKLFRLYNIHHCRIVNTPRDTLTYRSEILGGCLHHAFSHASATGEENVVEALREKVLSYLNIALNRKKESEDPMY